MAEFAQNPTGHNRQFGDCHNPWNLPYITGGSSSGSGAAVAARFDIRGTGLRHRRIDPAAGGGLRRHRASSRRRPGFRRYGAMPLSFSLDNVGPLARTARDCALVLGADRRARPERPDQRRSAGARLRGRARPAISAACGSACRDLFPGRRRRRRGRGGGTRAGGAGRARRHHQPDRPAADGRGRRLWRHHLPGRGRHDPCRVAAHAAAATTPPISAGGCIPASPSRRRTMSNRSAAAARSCAPSPARCSGRST